MNTSKEQTLQLLETNAEAVVNFILDNNPSAVQSQMDSIQLLPSSIPNPSKEDLKGILMNLVKIGSEEARETFKYCLEVEYADGKTNYTGGFQTELEEGIRNLSSVATDDPNTMVTRDGEPSGGGGAWLGIVNGVLGVANSVFGWLVAQEQTDQAQAIAEANRYDAMRNTAFGIPREVLVAMIAVIGVVAIVLIFKAK